MKKKLWLLTAVLLSLTLVLTACGDEIGIEGEQSEAKTGDNGDEASADGGTDEAEEADDGAENEGSGDDVWTYYDNATWSEDFNGLQMEIQKVVVTNDAPAEDGSDGTQSAVGVKFKMENTTEDKFTTYPDQAELVTSTGEQISMPSMLYSDHLGGEIDKGVIKEGDIIWYLERGEADKIEWIKMTWDAREGPEDDFEADIKEFEVELELN